MSMDFGTFLLMGIWKLITHGSDALEDKLVDNRLKKESDPNSRFYINRRGQKIDKETGHVVIKTLINHDSVEWDCNTCKVLVNYSQIRRDKEEAILKDKTKKNGGTAYRISTPKEYQDLHLRSSFFRDAYTGETYISKDIGDIDFYIRVSDGKIMRKTDLQIKMEKEYGLKPSINKECIERYYKHLYENEFSIQKLDLITIWR